jgi:REP element-mobilizing transposase RayT
MPNHIHILITPSEKGNISKIMHDFKSHTAQVINETFGRDKSLWQEGFYEHVTRDKFDFKRKIDYIHKNPLNSGAVKELEDYQFSSFKNYYMEDESLIKIDRVIF